ncbi:Crp/Fnr family transcriptional regulator [Phaeobacter sp.]|uniref:Crp/Fnr family transcriptional regulator n=1 Tax=Phaeobacter sp. TaxID=1902409 RepID=UPI0025CC782C|nr:Crp/Fnr family transcriptional regulator [Phaeobacter sp.]
MTVFMDHGSVKFLDLLGPELQKAIEDCEVRRSFESGRTIFSTGDEVEHLIIVRSGGVRMGRLSPGGRETILAVLGEGHFIGIMGLLTGRKRTQIAVTVGETTLAYISKADFLALMQRHPEIAAAALPATLSRLDIALNMLDDLRLLPLPAYTAVVLQNMLAAAPEPGVLQWSQSDLALAVGASRVSVGKALKKLEAKGLIALKYGAIVIPDAQALSDWIDEARADHLAP